MEDEKIIELFWNRKEDAIWETDNAYGRRLYGLANNILRSFQDSEECVNDTYLRTWEAIPPRRPGHFFGFLAAICRNVSLNRLDWRDAAKRKAEVVALTEDMELCIPDPGQERQMEGKEIGRLLNAFLAAQPKESRMIFVRRYWDVDTISQIATRYGISESKVKMRLSRTREKLRIFLEKEGVVV